MSLIVGTKKYLSYFNNLKKLVAAAVSRGQALMIYLT
jgi:hypothetical protein